MESKFAKIVTKAQEELLENTGGANNISPEEVEGMMRWAAAGDPTSFQQFDQMKGEQYVGGMLGAYRQQAQQQPQAQAAQPAATSAQPTAQPAATSTQPVATGTTPTTGV